MAAIQKQNLQLNFSQGLDTKNDPFQVKPGKMLVLENAIFDKIGRFAKRNGFGPLLALPDTSFTDINTYAGNLIAVGNSFQFFNNQTNDWIDKGLFQPMDVQVTPMVRNNSNQASSDTAIAPNGLACTAFVNLLPASPSQPYYQIVDSLTGHIVVPAVALPSGAGQIVTVYTLGANFIVVFPFTGNLLRYIAIPWATPLAPLAPATLITGINTIVPMFDGIVNGTRLYMAAAAGADIKYQALNSNLTLDGSNTSLVADPGSIAMVADASDGKVWATWWEQSDDIIKSVCFNSDFTTFLGRRSLTGAIPTGVPRITGAATGGTLTVIYETFNDYGYPTNNAFPLIFPSAPFTSKVTITEADVIGTPTIISRGIGVAGKGFFLAAENNTYFLGWYGNLSGGELQPTYFLMDIFGNIVAKLAYQNGGGGGGMNLPNVYVSGLTVKMGYLVADEIQPVNRAQGGTGSGVHASNGINLVSFTFSNRNLIFNEIGGDHHFTGGFLWMYDGVKPVEHGFHLYPEDIGLTTSAAGGGLIAQTYFYYVTYEWTDAAGNIHRSAPSIPTSIVTTGGTSTNTLKIPTLRLTYKTGNNPVRIVIYRWSSAQQIAYQITSITAPIQNDTTIDSITYIDAASDASIIGNLILYTTGGVVENTGAPASAGATLFKSRLFIINAEDRNVLSFSKQVISGVPVEMSDLFTIYVPPTIGALGNTGPIITISAMDDKLIIFKRNAIYYITGNGPDITGANNDFSDPIFITGTVGCTNLKSVVLTPIGLIFQTDKGIWLLGRDLQTQYIGAPVEFFNSANVISAQTILGETQIRLTLDSGVTLMYDYFYQQWGTFVNIPGISTTIYQNLLTYLSTDGQTVYQETPSLYLDGAAPVLMRFTTAWINLAGLQGYERAYFFYLLATWLSPHFLTVQIAYDYDPAIAQTTTITPDNFGQTNTVEQWRVFFSTQKCQAFQLTITEVYDPSLGVPAGAGLTLSGLDLVVGAKSGYPRIKAAHSAG